MPREKAVAPPGVWTKEMGKESLFQVRVMQRLLPIVVGHGLHRELLMHPPNGRDAGGPAQGAHWKSMGVVAGYPDIMFFHPGSDLSGKQYIGLAIELKVWGKQPTPEQELIHFLLRKQGWFVETSCSIEVCETLLTSYLAAHRKDA